MSRQIQGTVEELIELIDYCLRREPVMDRAIYRFQNVQRFAADYERWKEVHRHIGVSRVSIESSQTGVDRCGQEGTLL